MLRIDQSLYDSLIQHQMLVRCVARVVSMLQVIQIDAMGLQRVVIHHLIA